MPQDTFQLEELLKKVGYLKLSWTVATKDAPAWLNNNFDTQGKDAPGWRDFATQGLKIIWFGLETLFAIPALYFNYKKNKAKSKLSWFLMSLGQIVFNPIYLMVRAISSPIISLRSIYKESNLLYKALKLIFFLAPWCLIIAFGGPAILTVIGLAGVGGWAIPAAASWHAVSFTIGSFLATSFNAISSFISVAIHGSAIVGNILGAITATITFAASAVVAAMGLSATVTTLVKKLQDTFFKSKQQAAQTSASTPAEYKHKIYTIVSSSANTTLQQGTNPCNHFQMFRHINESKKRTNNITCSPE